MNKPTSVDEILRKVFILGLNRGKDKDALFMTPLTDKVTDIQGISFPEAEQAINRLIEKQVVEARIKELEKLVDAPEKYWMDLQEYGDHINLFKYFNDRIKELKELEGKK